MNRITTDEAARLLKQQDNILILTHRSPDGDTLGSAYAVCRALRQMGKRANVICDDVITDKYSYLYDGLDSTDFEPQFILAVDVADLRLLGGLKNIYGERVDLCIDHHASNTGYAENLLLEDRAACAEIIYELLKVLGTPIDKKIAECIYTGISTDTGCFRYSNVRAHTFETAAALMAAKPDIYSINRVMFEIKRFARLQLEAYLTRTMTFFAEGRIGICTIPSSIRQELSLTEDDVDDISGYARKIEGVELAAMLREQADGTVKISLRSGKVYDAGAICVALGGGGHFSAAGATVRGTPAEAADILLAEIYELYPELK